MEQPQAAPQQTQRQKFGEVLRFHREQRQLTARRVGDMICQSREAVENHEAGHTVPDGKAWDKYKGIVNKRLGAYSELRQRALAEAALERDTIIRSMEQRKMVTANGHNKPPIIGTNLGDKLIAANAPPVEIPRPVIRLKAKPEALAAAEAKRRITAGEQLGVNKEGVDAAGRRAMPDRPVGSMSRKSVDERIAWARHQLRERPRMPVNGPDGLLVLLRKRFGIGLDPDTCQRIKAEVHAEFSMLPPSIPAGIVPVVRSPGVPAGIPHVQAPPVFVRAEITPPAPKDPSADIEAAVQLILGSVPGLHTFTITVDDKGEASVDYAVREMRVVESAGSLKVRR